MENELSKVYIMTDNVGKIVRCDGGYTVNNIKDYDNWILIDEGIGDRFNLCQSHYFDALYTEDGIPRYKLVDGVPHLRSDDEIGADRTNVSVPEKSTDERVNELEQALRILLTGKE